MFDLSLTNIIVGVTVVISLVAMNNRQLVSKLILNPYQVVHRREYYRVITHGFIHADFLHLAFNMYVLHWVGNILEIVLTDSSVFSKCFPEIEFWGVSKGYLIYTMVYLGGLMFAVLPSMKKHNNNPGYNSLGASGAVSSVLMAVVLLLPTYEMNILFIPIDLPAIVVGVLILALEYFMAKRGNTRIAHDAHLFGGLFGIIVLLVVKPQFGLHFLSEIGNYIGLIY